MGQMVCKMGRDEQFAEIEKALSDLLRATRQHKKMPKLASSKFYPDADYDWTTIK